MGRLIFVTHPEVVIDPATPVPDWPLSDTGRERMEAFAGKLAQSNVDRVWSSAEQKALDGAEILARLLSCPTDADPELGENDRSSTGYVAPPEFWEIVGEFFAHPERSVRGWERAVDAQARVVRAIGRIASQADGTTVIVSHGGVGRLLMANIQGVPIGQESRPSNPGGGCYFEISTPDRRLLTAWRDIDTL